MFSIACCLKGFPKGGPFFIYKDSERFKGLLGKVDILMMTHSVEKQGFSFTNKTNYCISVIFRCTAILFEATQLIINGEGKSHHK